MNTVVSIIAFILVLGAVVLIHELGHFIAAKLSGVVVEEFALGMGPTIWSLTYKGTIYSIKLFPIGGFVRMLGEEDSSDEPGSFSAQPISRRLFIISAGVLMNVVLASLLYLVFLAINSFSLIMPSLSDYNFAFAETEKVIVLTYVEQNSPAEIAGIQAGSLLRTVDGAIFSDAEEFRDYVKENIGEELDFELEDIYSREVYSVSVTPREPETEDQGALGVVPLESKRISYTGIHKIFSGLEHTYNMIAYTIVIFKDLVVAAIQTGDITYVSDSVSGPVGVYVATDLVLETSGILGLIDITALMSASLAFMNLLPFPALDGGHIFLLALEKIRGKKLDQRVEYWLTAIGFFSLMFFMVLISAKDLFQFGIIEKLMFWK